MRRLVKNKARRATVLVLIVGLLAMLFMVVTAYISLARFDRLTTRLAGRGQQTQQILNSVTDVLAGQIAQLSTGDLTATLKGANYAAMPGGKGTPWLVSMEPVLNPSWSGTHIEPKDYVYAAVTSLTGNPSVGRAVGALMLGDPNNTGVINPYNPSADITGYTKLNARQPFMDADGDGVSDTGFHGVALLTELANAMVGKALSIDPIPTIRVGSTTIARRSTKWRRRSSRTAGWCRSASATRTPGTRSSRCRCSIGSSTRTTPTS